MDTMIEEQEAAKRPEMLCYLRFLLLLLLHRKSVIQSQEEQEGVRELC